MNNDEIRNVLRDAEIQIQAIINQVNNDISYEFEVYNIELKENDCEINLKVL